MKFNIAYMGPMSVFNVRRDFLLALQYGLQDCGHDVILNRNVVDITRLNILISTYWLTPEACRSIASSGRPYIHVNTEIIADGMLNYKPEKCDFLGAYVPIMQNAIAAWDVVEQNLDQYPKYGMQGNFLRWGYHEKLKEIEHKKDKDIDVYFFGTMSDHRKQILEDLIKAKLLVLVDQDCPTFLRNDRIARAKVNLSLSQDQKFTHVPSFRTCYLSNNDCYIVSEPMHDTVGYLDSCDVVKTKEIVSHIKETKNDWKRRGEENCESFKRFKMKDCMQELLDLTF